MPSVRGRWSQRLPFYVGWLFVAITDVTMAIAMTARTAFSLLPPPPIDDFKGGLILPP